ncbi:MAG TPA: AAA family ATPase, partial [Roseiarcus sp.]|nr:AAA family ATPase [Roseiarcus sp.]
AIISQIVMKLLAKTAEERYQTAAGLEHDLRRCLVEWELNGRIEPFALGERDIPDRLMIREKLYGRERDVEALLAAFDRVVTSGAPELVLVSGYSGIGKSSVVNELHKGLVPPRGLFASGKFDQVKRDIPYATLAQAFESLVRSLLSKSDAELSRWRDALLEALGPNGRLMTDLIPELKLIIGEQPPIPEVEPRQAHGRFQLVFRCFIGVFARPEHPLVLFLDDLQWLDAATIDLLEDLLTQVDVQHLLLIGAYRDNEVDAAHPLMRKLRAIRSSGAKVSEIKLEPLSREDVEQLIADTLRCEVEDAGSLSKLVHAKTGGNPLFVLQFVYALADEGLLAFDHQAQRWSWDLDRIHAKGYADNVVDLMVGKLARLPDESQEALQQLSCLGNVADITTLANVLGSPEEEVHAALWEAVRLELVERRPGAYRFVHDRVQEAAYSLVPEAARAAAHLRIGRLLIARTPPERREEEIFEIVGQLNRGAALIASREEREQLAEFNLIAGQRAKSSAAYASALKLLAAGEALVPEDAWERRRSLIFDLELRRAECEFLTGALTEAEERATLLSARTQDCAERAAIASLRMEVCLTLGQSPRAVEVAIEFLRGEGIELSSHPTDVEAQREYDRVRLQIGSRTADELLDLPLMTDPTSLAILDVLTKLVPAALFTDANLYCLATCKAVGLSLDRGYGDGSCPQFEWFGLVAGTRFGDYKAGFVLGQVGYALVERLRLQRFKARTYMLFAAHVIPWAKNIKTGRDVLRSAFDAADKDCDITFAQYSLFNLTSNLLASGDCLGEIQEDAKQKLIYARRIPFQAVIDIMNTQLALIKTLRGLTYKFGFLDDDQFDERRIEERFIGGSDSTPTAICWYWIRKLQARFLAGDYDAAMDALFRAQQLFWATTSMFESAEYHFYGALSRAAHYSCAPTDEHRQVLDDLALHWRQLRVWAENCPENFENRAALVAAEIARIEGRPLDAMDLYEQAIQSARRNGFIHNEALACELAARFYEARGNETISHAYMRNAFSCYARWGADGKVRQLDELYPGIREEERTPAPTSTIRAPVESLDLATVVSVSQAVSGEIVLEKLIDTLMRTAIEQAGAERGLLILARGAEQRIEAEATTAGDMVTVHLRDTRTTAEALPESVLRHVVRSGESVVLDDAAARPPFAEDPYIRERQARSILCLPLVNRGKLNGVLYLENNLTPRAFAPARTAVLKLLASQAAISLENTHLYSDLAEREAKIRRLVDANIIGIFIWNLGGQIVEANDAFLRIVGYEREDIVSGRLYWRALTPNDWLERDERRRVPELRMTGSLQPYEKEYFRKDGSRVPVLIGAANLDESANRGVAFVLDLTERKRAEADARESERRHRETQMQLAHANRVATMGQLTASIAHEVNQPIAATVANAQAALRWLGAEPPNTDEARQALGRIARDGDRAGAVIGRIRSLIKGAPPRNERVEINAAIHEVIELTHSEATKTGVSVQTDVAEGLPLVQGDRVELQQVILNLILNAFEAMSGM